MNILSNKMRDYNWNYKRILLDNDSYHSNKRLKIGIIDSGIDINNPNVSIGTVIGTSFLEDVEDVLDNSGNGTQVFGVIDTIIKNVEYRFYKIRDSDSTNSLNMIKAIFKAVEDQVDIINISLGIYKDKKKEKDRVVIAAFNKVISYAKNKNVLIVASSGNEGLNMDIDVDIIHIPSDLKDVISVGSSNKTGNISKHTNYGENLNLLAPTGDWIIRENEISFTDMILTYGENSNYFAGMKNHTTKLKGLVLAYGTSLAVPQVVAALAILIDKYPNLERDEYIEKLYSNSIQLFEDNRSYIELRIVI